jgi:hypothetical protein
LMEFDRSLFEIVEGFNIGTCIAPDIPTNTIRGGEALEFSIRSKG